MPNPGDPRQNRPERDPKRSDREIDPAHGVDRLGTLLYAELTEGLPLLSPSLAELIEKTVGNSYERLRVMIAEKIAEYNDEILKRVDEAHAKLCREGLEQRTLENFMREQSELTDVQKIAVTSGYYALKNSGAVASFVAEDFEERLDGAPNRNVMNFPYCRRQIWTHSLAPEVVKTLFSTETLREAGYRLPFISKPMVISTPALREEVFGGLPNFEKIADHNFYIAPLQHEATSVGLLLAAKPKAHAFVPAITHDLDYIAKALTTGVTHIKRINDRSREGS